MKHLLYILILITNCFFHNVKCISQQVYFNERYDFYNYPDVAWNILDIDSGYLAFGMVCDSIWWYCYKIGVLYIDNSGNEIWKKSFAKEGCCYYSGGPGSVIPTIYGGYAMAGTIVDSSGNNYATLYRFDNNGDTLWTKRYSNSSWQAGVQCKQTPDGGYIIIGRSRIYDDPDGDFWLIKTDSSGNLEWDRTYGGNYYEYGLSVDVCNDSGYILAGTTRSYGSDIGSTSDIYIIKTDNSGNAQWTRVFGGPYGDAIWNVQQTSDGGYVIGGSLTDTVPVIDFSYGRPYIIKLDSSGNTEWEKTYGPVRFNTGLFMVRELDDGSFIAAGQTTDSIGFHGMGLVLKVSSNGDSIWYRTHEISTGSNDQNKLRDIQPTSDGGFIAAGKVLPDQDMWVIKLDSMGCAYAGCDTQTYINEQAEIKNYEVKIYPNPTKENFTIEVYIPGNNKGIIKIYSIRGIIKENFPLKTGINNFEISTIDWAKGIYICNLLIDGKVKKTEKMILNR